MGKPLATILYMLEKNPHLTIEDIHTPRKKKTSGGQKNHPVVLSAPKENGVDKVSKRDFQRKKVYTAEKILGTGNLLPEMNDIQKLCNRVYKSKWREKHFPDIKGIVAHDGRRRIRAGGCNRSGYVHIKMPRWSRCDWLTLHEIAHGLCPHDKHGPKYTRAYLMLVRRFLGVAQAKALQDSFDKHGVLYEE